MSLTLAVIFLKEVGSQLVLVEECRAHVFLDCGYRPRHETQYRGQRGTSSTGRGRYIGWTREGHRETTSTTCFANETSRGIDWELLHAWTTRYNECSSYAARMVDISGVWWARHEPCVNWRMDSWIWGIERPLSISRLSAHLRALRTAPRFYRQHLLFYPNLHPVPPRESGTKSYNWRPKLVNSAPYRAADYIDMLFLHGIR